MQKNLGSGCQTALPDHQTRFHLHDGRILIMLASRLGQDQ
jgi:hypothetical protein